MAWQRYIKNNEIKIQQFISAVFNWNLHRFFCMKFTYNGFYDTEGKLVSMRGVFIRRDIMQNVHIFDKDNGCIIVSLG